MDSVGKKQGARLLTHSLWLMKHMQVTGIVAGCPNAVLGLPREMSAVNTNGARAAPMQSPCAAACKAVPAEH